MSVQDRSPDSFGPYRVLERIGEGGMGVVYLATDAEDRPVAVKVLRPAVAGDPDARRRLAREVETMRRVRSPYVAEVIDADVTCDPPYIVTRYVRGRTLEQVVTAGGPRRGQELAAVALGLAAALTAVHAAGVVHRDVKPGNIMLAGGEPVVIDFGIAHLPDSTRITQTGMFMGTPGYLAPEVIEGNQSGQASDVHSWGATVAFAATGRPPFGTGSFETIFYRIVHGQPDLDGCPPPLLPLVAAALARDPARRPGAAELAERAAALVPAALVPGPALTTAPGAVPAGVPRQAGSAPGAAGTLADWAVPAGRGGAGAWPAGPAAPAPAVVPASVAASAAAGPAAAPAWPSSTQPFATGSPPDGYVGDLLPPVRYLPPPAGQGRSAALRDGRPAEDREPAGAAVQAGRQSSRRRLRLLFVLAAVAVGASASVVLPVAGTLAALAVIIALRAADLTGRRLGRRRTARGTRASDPAVAALTYPVMLARSVITSVLLLPAALVAAGLVTGVTIVAAPADSFAQACAYGAGALVACCGIGPGSGGFRRQLGKLFDAAGSSAGAATVALIGICALAVAAMATAVAARPPFLWPLHHVGGLGGMHAVLAAADHARAAMVRLARRVVG
jgi:hypothetical protein